MSMPSFPPNGADLTREEALTMIIASIAMEELALSHILNAEGEKLQYILGTLPGSKPGAAPQDVLAVNKSVAALLEAVAQNQMLLKTKLDQVLEFCPPPPCAPPQKPEPCPCAPYGKPEPCPFPPPGKPESSGKSILQLEGQREGLLWDQGCRLPLRRRVRRGEDICLDEQAPTQIRLNSQKAYLARCTLKVQAMHPSEEAGAICFRQTPQGAFTEAPPLLFSLECGGSPQTLQHSAMFYPRMTGGGAAELALVLEAESALCVEQAVVDVIEL